MNDTTWRSVLADPPPEGVEVEVANNGGVRLVYDRGLWWFPDRSMYVYYTPDRWRPIGCRAVTQPRKVT